MQAPFQPQHPTHFDTPEFDGHERNNLYGSPGASRQAHHHEPDRDHLLPEPLQRIVDAFLVSNPAKRDARPHHITQDEQLHRYLQDSHGPSGGDLVRGVDHGIDFNDPRYARSGAMAVARSIGSRAGGNWSTPHPKHVFAALTDPDFKSKMDERARRRQARDDPRASAHHEHDDGRIGLHGFRHEHDSNMEAFHSDRWAPHHLNDHTLVPSSSKERTGAFHQHGNGMLLPSNSPSHSSTVLHYPGKSNMGAVKSRVAPTSLMGGQRNPHGMNFSHPDPVNLKRGLLHGAPMLPSTHMMPDAHHGHSQVTHSEVTEVLVNGKPVARHEEHVHHKVEPHSDGRGHTITTSQVARSSTSHAHHNL